MDALCAGRKVKHAPWGFTAQRDGKQVRRFREDWTKEDAERALSEWTLGLDVPAASSAPTPSAPEMTLEQACTRYLEVKEAGRSAPFMTTG